MKIIVVSDDDEQLCIHDKSGVELVVSCGDLWEEKIREVGFFYEVETVLAVKGNHDSSANFSGDIVDLHFNVYHYHNLIFGGFNGCYKYKPKGNFLYEQDEVNQMLQEFPRVDVFVAHNSPSGIHERDSEVHQGFDAFRGYIEKNQPKLFLHGHQHINQESILGETRVVSVFGEKIVDV